jgi:predicted Zn-dependent protease
LKFKLFNRLVCLSIGGILLGALLAAAYPGDHDQALRLFREGNGLFDRDHFAEAVAAYDRALEQDPQSAEIYHNRALANEMVSRLKAIEDWRRFVELGTNLADLKWDVARAQARLQILQSMPAFPSSLQPDRYAPTAGDYYWQVAKSSESEKWSHFPIKVFLGNAPDFKWQVGAQEAYNIWSAVFPLELVALPDRADIRMGWEESVQGAGHAGEEMDWVRYHVVGDQLAGRQIAIITVDVSRRWSKDEMRAIILHEMGHALGIKSHSESRGDIMYWQIQENVRNYSVDAVPLPVFWRSLVSKPSQRDINTLIRLYNCPGPITRFQ